MYIFKNEIPLPGHTGLDSSFWFFFFILIIQNNVLHETYPCVMICFTLPTLYATTTRIAKYTSKCLNQHSYYQTL